MQKNISFKPTK